MNILPKKSWHVKTRKNIERVLRDEAEAERVARLEQDRVLRAEQEARNRLLRARAGIAEPAPGNINLFEDVASQSAISNEGKAEEAKRERGAAAANRLGRTSDVNRPWYCDGEDRNTLTRMCKQEPPSDEPTNSRRITSIYDPMIAIMDAERIVKARRAQQRRAEMSEDPDQRFPQSSSNLTIEGANTLRPKKTVIVQSDSSPEIVKVVDNRSSLKHKRSKRDSCRKSKKHKRDHSSRHHHHSKKHHKKHKKHRH